jgi:hypothetical protein
MSLKDIMVDGKVYTPVLDKDGVQGCSSCAFRNDSRGCRLSNLIVSCSDTDSYFVPASTLDLRPDTQQMKDWKGIDTVVPQSPGTKYDQGKLQYTLVPPYALQEVARNLTEGLKKYKERNNWQKVEGAEQRYMDALMRHFEAIRRGEIYDKDSSDPTISHMSAVAVNAMFLLEFMYNPELKGNV